MRPAIRVENLSKCYRIGTREHPANRNLTEALVDGARGLWRGLTGRKRAEKDSDGNFWALKDVSFEVKPGEVVGIIGRNGAGKSTLLKVLSRIVEPTGGRCEVRGRMGSLLEVGTGFHPELTGRENVYLNGSVLGMSQREINHKLDEIVAFSEVEQFIDTPVKRYSSGMYVRLAFAIASHLEPEILVVDEVLAVGDVKFQQKCIGRMNEIRRHGRTVLVVSHNFGSIEALCTQGILIENGHVTSVGPVREIIRTYLQQMELRGSTDLATRLDRSGSGKARLVEVLLCDEMERPVSELVAGHKGTFRFRCSRYYPGISCVFTLYNEAGLAVTTFSSQRQGPADQSRLSDPAEFKCHWPEVLLLPGRYRMNVALHCGAELVDHVEAACLFDVTHGSIRGRVIEDGMFGVVHIPHAWTSPEGCQSPRLWN